MKFDKRIVGLYGAMSAMWLFYGVYNAFYHVWAMLAICLGLIALNVYLSFPSMLRLAKKEPK